MGAVCCAEEDRHNQVLNQGYGEPYSTVSTQESALPRGAKVVPEPAVETYTVPAPPPAPAPAPEPVPVVEEKIEEKLVEAKIEEKVLEVKNEIKEEPKVEPTKEPGL